MRTMNMEQYGVSGLSKSAMNAINGGWMHIIAPIAIWFAIESASNPKASAAALQNGFEAGFKE